MSTFLRCFMWFMIGDTVGLLTLLFWQGLCSLNKDEPVRPVTQNSEELGEFIVHPCEVCIYKETETCMSHSCIDGIVEYLNQKVGKE
jgi:hypothetical protein